MGGMNPDEARRLIGVGVGPGDPELMTVKAIRTLEAADVILVPATEASDDGPGRAEQVVLAAAPQVGAKIQRIPFAMRERTGVGPKRAAAWQTSADAAVAAFEAGARTVVFATVGDPAVFSTFSYLRGAVVEKLDDIEFALVPGITAMQALAAASTTPLVEGKEILALVPATVGSAELGQVLDVCDSVTIYKAGRQLPEVLDQLRERERRAVVGTNVSLPEQELREFSGDEVGVEASYFSAVLSVPERTVNGGRL